jgi:diacylglycerol kinase family enzyme/thymidylate kinase
MGTLVVAVVGIDGCGKTSTVRGVAECLAEEMPIATLGDVILGGSPGAGLKERHDIPLSRSSQIVGRVARGLRRPSLYKNLKILEFIERSHARRYLLEHDPARVILGDGDPLVNVSAWAAAKYLRGTLAGDDTGLHDLIQYMAGRKRIPWRRFPYFLRHAWQLALANRLRLTRFPLPDLVVVLQIAPATSMERIRSRGLPLQAHETEQFLADLAEAYERVAAILEQRCGVRVVCVNVEGAASSDETVAKVCDTVHEELQRRVPAEPEAGDPGTIEVVATTMSGSFEDQQKVARILPAFEEVTTRPVRVHLADTHEEAESISRRLVAGGARTIVSAGGAGTFNAVLEGCLDDGRVPPDLRLAFLRKGSADLIGKALGVPDDLEAAAAAIAGAIDAGHELPADVIAIETTEPGQLRHMVGFGGIGVFGDVPRFTEGRVIKYYKGLLGTAFGDLGPFYVGLALATLWWSLRRLFRRVPLLELSLDDELLPPRRSRSVIVLNGDLGKDFPLGRGLPFGARTIRVVILEHHGPRAMLRQVTGSRTGKLLDDPAAFNAIVRDVATLTVRPVGSPPPFMVNVDGLRLMTAGAVRFSAAGTVRLVDAGAAAGAERPLAAETG